MLALTVIMYGGSITGFCGTAVHFFCVAASFSSVLVKVPVRYPAKSIGSLVLVVLHIVFKSSTCWCPLSIGLLHVRVLVSADFSVLALDFLLCNETERHGPIF